MCGCVWPLCEHGMQQIACTDVLVALRTGDRCRRYGMAEGTAGAARWRPAARRARWRTKYVCGVAAGARGSRGLERLRALLERRGRRAPRAVRTRGGLSTRHRDRRSGSRAGENLHPRHAPSQANLMLNRQDEDPAHEPNGARRGGGSSASCARAAGTRRTGEWL
jgi:hypothetical protein